MLDTCVCCQVGLTVKRPLHLGDHETHYRSGGGYIHRAGVAFAASMGPIGYAMGVIVGLILLLVGWKAQDHG